LAISQLFSWFLAVFYCACAETAIIELPPTILTTALHSAAPIFYRSGKFRWPESILAVLAIFLCACAETSLFLLPVRNLFSQLFSATLISYKNMTNHIFGIPDPYFPIHFATFMALRWILTRVICENSVQPMLKAKKCTAQSAHAPCHVICKYGVRNNHICGIPDPNFPIHFRIHYTTFMGLWWRLTAVYLWKFHAGAICSKNLSRFWPNFHLLGDF